MNEQQERERFEKFTQDKWGVDLFVSNPDLAHFAWVAWKYQSEAITKLQAENEALRKDAERYRKLFELCFTPQQKKTLAISIYDLIEGWKPFISGIDEYLDAAIEQTKKGG